MTTTIDNVIDALAAAINIVVPGVPVVRGQQNLVAQPPNGYIMLTELFTIDVETYNATYNESAQQTTYTTPKKMHIQVDFLGDSSGEWCNAVKTIYKTPWMCAQLEPSGIDPLYMDDGHQSPIIQGSAQYETRWVATLVLQFNPSVVVSEQSATSLNMNIIQGVP